MKKPTRRLLSILLTLTMLLGLLPAMNLTALATNGVEITQVGDTEVAADDANVTAPTAFVGQPYSLQLSASGSGTLTWSNPHTPLPAGLTLDSDTGLISGTPTATAYSASYTIKVSNGTGGSDSILVSFNCCEEADKPTIDTSALPAGYVGSFYYQTIEYGGMTPFETQILAGTLPPGLEFNKSQGKGAYIRGTPTTAGTYTFTVLVKNVAGETTKTYTMTIGNANVPPSIETTGALDYGVVGQEYSYQLIATGTNTAENPITWSITSGALPAELSLNETTGLISGTPTAAGIGQAMIRAMNKAANGITNQAASASVSIAVYDLPTIDARSFPNGSLGQSYSSQSIDTTDATEVAVTGGSLPEGMTLQWRSGNWSELSGTPTEAGTFNFTVTATRKVGDDVIGRASQEYTLVIDGPAITTASLPNATQNSSYNAQLTCTSVGDLTKTWSVVSGTIPTGLSLDLQTGDVISGTPTVTGTFNFTVRLTVSNYSVDKALSITVDEQPETLTSPGITESDKLPYAVVGREYSHQFTATGTQPITWSVNEGSSLPDGLELNAKTGTLSGTPSCSEGQKNFHLTASNSFGGQNGSDKKYFYMNIYAPPAIEEKTLPDGKLNSSYSSVNFTVHNASSDDTATKITGGALPAGMELTDYGNWFSIGGTPTEYGTFTFQVTATRTIDTDVIGTDTKVFTLTIEGPPAAPTFSYPSGTSFMGTLNVNIYCDTPGALIYYTMDGTDPSRYSSAQATIDPISISNSCTIKAIAYNADFSLKSEIVSAEYTKVDSPAAPTASPEPGSFVGSSAVTLSCATDNTIIYYTTDGSEPVKGGTSLIYSSPIAISADTTIKARAYLATDLSIYSDVAEFTYTKAEGYSVSGQVASYGDAAGTVTVKLMQGSTLVDTWAGTGNSANYTFGAVAPGDYTLEVSKANHVTRSYEVTVTTDSVTKDVKIWLLGDVNQDGNVNIQDVIRLLNHVNNSNPMADTTPCNINSDAAINIQDVIRLLNHVNNSNPLY